jgi:hypothetical protein
MSPPANRATATDRPAAWPFESLARSSLVSYLPDFRTSTLFERLAQPVCSSFQLPGLSSSLESPSDFSGLPHQQINITNMNWSYELSYQQEHSLSINGTRSRNSRSDSTAHQNFNKNNQSIRRSIHSSIRFNNNIFGNFSNRTRSFTGA